MPVNERFEISIVDRDYTQSMEFSHTHSFYEIYLLINGKCELLIGEKTYNMTPGSLYIIPKHIPHQTTYEKHIVNTRLSLEFSENYIQRIFNKFGTQSTKEKIMSTLMKLPENIVNNIVTLSEIIISETQSKDIYAPFQKDVLFETLIIYILRHHTSYYDTIYHSVKIKDEDMRTILSYIANNFHRKITLSEIADTVHLNPSYLSQKFKLTTGKCFKEYLNSIRISHSERMLIETNLSITEIAFKCGFESSNYFGDAFKKINNISPTHFRQIKGRI